VIVAVFVFMNSSILLGSNDSRGSNSEIRTTSHFNNSYISFNYPYEWGEMKNNNYTFSAFYKDIILTVSIDEIGDYPIDDFMIGLKNAFAKSSTSKISSVNKTSVDNLDAYEMSVIVSGENKSFSKFLFFIYNEKLFTFQFQSSNSSTELDNAFNIVKNSIKVNK